MAYTPVLILTGGTLSMEQDPEAGHLKASDNSLLDCAKKVGIKVFNGYRYGAIDSIDYNMGHPYPKDPSIKIYENYQAMRDAAIQVLKRGDIPVFAGGTDTQAWYATHLTKDLMRRGYLRHDDEKVVFLSSMQSHEENPSLVENILTAGRLFAENLDNIHGGFAITAKDLSGTTLAVHDVRNQFDKISPSGDYTFRSKCPAGEITISESDGKKTATFTENMGYVAPAFPAEIKDIATRIKPFDACIAPPLLGGQPPAAILAYLRMLDDANPPFHGGLIEGFPKGDSATSKEIVDTVKRLTSRGIRVVFCQRLQYDEKIDGFAPAPETFVANWETSPFAKALAKAGAEFKTDLPKDTYLDMMLPTARPVIKERDPTQLPVKPAVRLPKLRIRYVPDLSTMMQGMRLLAPHTENLVIMGLSGAVLPNSLKETAEDLKEKETDVYRTSEYGHIVLPTDEAAEQALSGTALYRQRYNAGGKMLKLVRPESELDEKLAKSAGRAAAG